MVIHDKAGLTRKPDLGAGISRLSSLPARDQSRLQHALLYGESSNVVRLVPLAQGYRVRSRRRHTRGKCGGGRCSGAAGKCARSVTVSDAASERRLGAAIGSTVPPRTKSRNCFIRDRNLQHLSAGMPCAAVKGPPAICIGRKRHAPVYGHPARPLLPQADPFRAGNRIPLFCKFGSSG